MKKGLTKNHETRPLPAVVRPLNDRPVRVLVVEDNPEDFKNLQTLFSKIKHRRYELENVLNLSQGLEELRRRDHEVYLVDYQLGLDSGMDFLREAVAAKCSVPVILLTAHDNPEVDLKAMSLGAAHFLSKNKLDHEILERSVRYALEQKRVEEAIRRQEEFFRALIENAQDGMVLLDAGGTARYASPSIETILGYTPREVVEKDLISLINPEDLAGAKGLFAQSLHSPDRVLRAEVRIKHKDGSWRFIETTGKSHEFKYPDFKGVVLNYRDITERKRAEESRLRLASLVESSEDAIYSVSMEGVVLSWNPGAQSIYGYTPDEIGGRDISLIVPEGREGEFPRLLEAARRGKAERNFNTRHKTKQGNEIYLSLTLSPVKDPTGLVRMVSVIARDMTATEKSSAVQEMLQTERDQLLERFQQQMERMPLAFILYDQHYSYTYWNPAAEKMFGFSFREAEGQIGLITPPLQRAGMKEKLKNMAKDKTLIHWEALENVRKDGKTIFCDWYVTPLYDLEGNFTGIMSMAIDVTERRKGEAALSESENRFRQIFEDSPIGMGLVGLDSRLIMVNPRFCEFIGYCAPELKGKSFVDLTHPEDVHLDMDNWEKLASGEIPRYEMEKRYIRKDGRLVWGRLLVTLIRDKAGKALYALGMVEDATATRKAAEVHSQLTAILQQTSDAVIGADLKGRIFSWNRGAEAMLGYSMEEIIGKSTALLVPLDREEEMEKVRELATREENVSNYETVMLKKNEGQVEVSVSVSTLKDPKGKIVGISVISRDITERKKAEASIRHHEEQMRLAQKMEAVGRLASGVAHDFNNLLNVIVGNAEFLVDGMEKGNPHLEEVGEIKKAVWRGAELTKQLLVFGKGQVSKPRPVNLNDLCVEMNKMLKRLIDSTIKPSIIQDKGLKFILIDPGQMQQVILNLVINARDAMPQGGHLIIETKNVDAADLEREQKPTLDPGSYVRLHVTDTGTGMTKETQNRLFEPFFTTKADKGTGLGLATVYAIVKQFKGHIFLKSTLGIGTTFSLYFPALEEVEAVSSLPEPIVLTPRGSETVLLAEDDEPVRKALVRILEKYGYRVLEAGSGKEAIQKVGDEPGSVKLLLTDAIMFEMNGRELADELVKTNPRMRIVFISGYSREILSEQGILHEGNRLIPKPFDVEELMREIRTALDEP